MLLFGPFGSVMRGVVIGVCVIGCIEFANRPIIVARDGANVLVFHVYN